MKKTRKLSRLYRFCGGYGAGTLPDWRHLYHWRRAIRTGGKGQSQRTLYYFLRVERGC